MTPADRTDSPRFTEHAAAQFDPADHDAPVHPPRDEAAGVLAGTVGRPPVVRGRSRSRASAMLEDRTPGATAPAVRAVRLLRLPEAPTITRFCLVDGNAPAAFVMIAERAQDMLVLPNGHRAGGACLVGGRWTARSAYMLHSAGTPISESRFWELVARAARVGSDAS